MYRTILASVSVVCVFGLSAFSATPPLINYQGSLTDGSGSPVADGSYSITFTIYDGNGNPVWTEAQNVVTTGGAFAVLLGSGTPINDTVFEGTVRYLGIKVGTDPEMSPLTRLVTVPYAFRTSTLDGATGGQIESELDLTNSRVTTDTVFGYRGQADNAGSGSAVGGFFGASATDSDSISSVGVVGESRSNGINIMPVGVFGRGVNASTGWSLGGKFEGKKGILINASSRGLENWVTGASTGFVYGQYNSMIGSGVAPAFGIFSNAVGNGANVFGLYSKVATTGPGMAYGVYVETSNRLLGTKKYGLYIDGEGAEGFDIYGQYADIKRENSGRTYGTYNKLNISNGGSGSVVGTSNRVTREASGGTGRLFGSYNIVRNENPSNRSSIYGLYSNVQSNHVGPLFGVYSAAPVSIFSWAGYFYGNVNVSGWLYKAAGSFKIDHPQDPENKYLYHSFVESPDMMNIYNGIANLDPNGGADVTLPGYFAVLNMDFRYQLTAVGAPGPNLYIAETIVGNKFKIAGGTPNSQVSWQVTGIRQDPWASANRMKVEVDKTGSEVGLYLHPEVYNQPPEKGIDYENLQVDPP